MRKFLFCVLGALVGSSVFAETKNSNEFEGKAYYGWEKIQFPRDWGNECKFPDGYSIPCGKVEMYDLKNHGICKEAAKMAEKTALDGCRLYYRKCVASAARFEFVTDSNGDKVADGVFCLATVPARGE